MGPNIVGEALTALTLIVQDAHNVLSRSLRRGVAKSKMHVR